ncbi:hypothetical protein GCM10009710_32230 [Aeromicrobium alkaliterrae]|uniref:MarR family transcriptional regulator n=2 Tax=Aeromicrobium alkaliterrae TaxID=302168 RepID=A0ABP4WA40_9ACTN
MQPPARQPLGFWTVRAGEAIGQRTRSALAELGVTQPQWWVLHQLSLHPAGVERTDVIDTVGPNDTAGAIEEAIASSQDNGWLVADGDSIRATATGAALFARCAALQAELQAERMHGITEAEFATTITVLQRTIENVGANAWHW